MFTVKSTSSEKRPADMVSDEEDKRSEREKLRELKKQKEEQEKLEKERLKEAKKAEKNAKRYGEVLESVVTLEDKTEAKLNACEKVWNTVYNQYGSLYTDEKQALRELIRMRLMKMQAAGQDSDCQMCEMSLLKTILSNRRSTR